MIEHKLLHFRMEIGEMRDHPEAKLDALANDGWRIVACSRTDLYLTVIMTRTAHVQQYVVDDPKGAFQRVFDSVVQAKRRT